MKLFLACRLEGWGGVLTRHVLLCCLGPLERLLWQSWNLGIVSPMICGLRSLWKLNDVAVDSGSRGCFSIQSAATVIGQSSSSHEGPLGSKTFVSHWSFIPRSKYLPWSAEEQDFRSISLGRVYQRSGKMRTVLEKVDKVNVKEHTSKDAEAGQVFV